MNFSKNKITPKIVSDKINILFYSLFIFTIIITGLTKPQEVKAAFPAVQTTNTSVETDNTQTSHTVNLPSGISAGDLLIVIFGMSVPDNVVITWPGGWNEFYRIDEPGGADAGMAGAWREATGSEGATITVSTDLGTRSAHVSYRITGAADPDNQAPQAAAINGTNGNSDPPNLAPTGGAKDYLWLAASARSHDGEGVISPPTNFTNMLEKASGTGSAHVLTSVARRELNASSQNPDAFTNGDSLAEWVAATIAIHPTQAIVQHTNSNFSLSAWVYPEGSIASKALAVKSSEIRLVTDSSGKPFCQTSNNSSWQTAATSSAALTLNTWKHVTCTYDQSILKVFVDGVLTASQSLSAAIDNTTNNWRFGSDQSTTFGDYQGKMDDIRLYNYTRTQAQVVEDMNAGHPAPGSPIGSAVAHWKFDEGYGLTANDTTSNANNLTLNKALWTNSGKFNKAWDGDGTTWLTRADDPDFDFAASDNFTITLWVKSDSATNPSGTEYIISKADSSPGYRIYFQDDGDLIFAIDDDTAFTPDDLVGNLGRDYYDGSWHHLAAVKTGTSKIELFVDGILIDTDSTLAATGTLENAVTLAVGDRTGADGGDELNGDLDEVKFYRLALTPAQVKGDMNKGSAQTFGAATDQDEEGFSLPNPIGHWNFNENSGQSAFDQSTSNLEGTLGSSSGADTNDPAWIPVTGAPGNVNGLTGSALNFDGFNDYVNVGTSTTLGNLTNNFTVSAWIKSDDLTAATTHRIIGAERVTTGTNGFGFGTRGTGLRFTTYSVKDYDSTTITLSTGTYYHVVAVMDSGDDVSFYVNGVFKEMVTHTSPALANTDDDYYIGAQTQNGSSTLETLFDGIIDNVQIFNTALTAKQVAWLYNRGAPIGHWKFDECSGNQANDSSGNGNTGTINEGGTGSNNAGVGTCSTPAATMWNGGATGKKNASLEFDGTDDYVNKSSADLPFGTGDFALSAWLKTTYDCTGGNCRVMHLEGGINANDEIRLEITSSEQAQLAIRDSTDTTASLTTSTASYADGNWHHLLVTVDRDSSTGVVLYVDGQVVATGNPTGEPGALNISQITIAADNAFTRNIEGQIDEIRVFNYVLSADQVRKVYNDQAVRFGSP